LEFLSHGLQAGFNIAKDEHLVLELAIGYSATGTTIAIEEVALTNQSLGSLEERVVALEERIVVLEDASNGSTTVLMEGIEERVWDVEAEVTALTNSLWLERERSNRRVLELSKFRAKMNMREWAIWQSMQTLMTQAMNTEGAVTRWNEWQDALSHLLPTLLEVFRRISGQQGEINSRLDSLENNQVQLANIQGLDRWEFWDCFNMMSTNLVLILEERAEGASGMGHLNEGWGEMGGRLMPIKDLRVSPAISEGLVWSGVPGSPARMDNSVESMEV
jgi:hypothetical protein